MGTTDAIRTASESSRSSCIYPHSSLNMDAVRAHHVLHRNGAMTDSIAPTDGKTPDHVSVPFPSQPKYFNSEPTLPEFEFSKDQGNPSHQREKLSGRHCKEEEEEGLCSDQWAGSAEQENNSNSDSEGGIVEMSTWRGTPSVKGSTETMRMLLLTCVSVGITSVHTRKTRQNTEDPRLLTFYCSQLHMGC